MRTHRLPSATGFYTARASGAPVGTIFRGGAASGWGLNDEDQLGLPDGHPDGTVIAIAAGSYYGMALTSTNTAYVWRDSRPLDQPAPVAGQEIKAIAAGTLASFALTQDGKVLAWDRDGTAHSQVPAELTSQTGDGDHWGCADILAAGRTDVLVQRADREPAHCA
jgi:hypothetical protein